MATVNINTTSPGYLQRHQEFRDIVQFWIPHLRVYAQLGEDERAAWRAADPFLNDIVRFVNKVHLLKEDVSI